jgi:asparagine synthase (glutamine-hydrolysing)
MSGIVGIVNLDGSPVDRELLSGMTHYLRHRGPDAQHTWIEENVGFGHALLRTTWESETERQPMTLDGKTWLTADCRVDGRDDLLRELAGQGRNVDSKATDPELILHAYAAWGEKCIDHLLGDFSFALWDDARKMLFCARDHFGVKPFFYSRIGRALVFSNDLNCLRCHPALSNDLDELGVADFLVYGYSLDHDRTVFATVKKLAPSHVLKCSGDDLLLERYWEMPMEEEIHYRREREYVDHFNELFVAAVRDRIRTNAVGVFMSGGMDSTTVAATAKRVMSSSGRPFDLRAHTVVFERLVPDQEGKYAKLAADWIGIPNHQQAADDIRFPSAEPELDWHPAIPRSVFDRGRQIAITEDPASMSRVFLRGDGADPLTFPPENALETMLRSGEYANLAKGYWLLARTTHRLPRLGVRTLLRKSTGNPDPVVSAPYPDWLRIGVAQKLNLRERWQREAVLEYPRVGMGLAHPYYGWSFDLYDPGPMRLPAETRFPFLDLRVVKYLLRLPSIPWAADKCILRAAMKDELPPEVSRRPKKGLAGHPWALLLPSAETKWWEPYLNQNAILNHFIDIGTLRLNLETVAARSQSTYDRRDIDVLRTNLLPIGLSLWLSNNYCTKFS